MKRLSVAALLVAALMLAGCTAASSSSTTTTPPSVASASLSPAAVVIHTFAFSPQDVKITAGTTVTWTNQDAILHTVTAGTSKEPGTAFNAKMDGVGSTFSFTFTKPGTYPYHCSIHDVMQGVVTVS